MHLNNLGWSEFFDLELSKHQNEVVGRIITQNKDKYFVLGEFDEVIAEVSGKFRYQTKDKGDFPVVGDWVVLNLIDNNSKGIIQKVLPRKTKVSRKVAGVKSDEQVISANIDTLFIVSSLNNNFNLRRIERYLVIAKSTGAEIVIVLTKADLCSDIEYYLKQIEEIAPDIRVVPLSSLTGNGLEKLSVYIQEGKTISLIGSSGVGKSTLINALIGDQKQETLETYSGDKGKHTTTSRELLFLPAGGMIIDNPGMRELQLLDNEEGLCGTFGDLEEYASRCRFSDCKHESEPGCAVRDAIEKGLLDPKRVENKKKLSYEIDTAKNRMKNKNKRFR